MQLDAISLKEVLRYGDDVAIYVFKCASFGVEFVGHLVDLVGSHIVFAHHSHSLVFGDGAIELQEVILWAHAGANFSFVLIEDCV